MLHYRDLSITLLKYISISLFCYNVLANKNSWTITNIYKTDQPCTFRTSNYYKMIHTYYNANFLTSSHRIGYHCYIFFDKLPPILHPNTISHIMEFYLYKKGKTPKLTPTQCANMILKKVSPNGQQLYPQLAGGPQYTIPTTTIWSTKSNSSRTDDSSHQSIFTYAFQQLALEVDDFSGIIIDAASATLTQLCNINQHACTTTKGILLLGYPPNFQIHRSLVPNIYRRDTCWISDSSIRCPTLNILLAEMLQPTLVTDLLD